MCTGYEIGAVMSDLAPNPAAVAVAARCMTMSDLVDAIVAEGMDEAVAQACADRLERMFLQHLSVQAEVGRRFVPFVGADRVPSEPRAVIEARLLSLLADRVGKR